MKHALVILKDGALVECEYSNIEGLFECLAIARFATFDKKTFACDTIARIEWID